MRSRSAKGYFPLSTICEEKECCQGTIRECLSQLEIESAAHFRTSMITKCQKNSRTYVLGIDVCTVSQANFDHPLVPVLAGYMQNLIPYKCNAVYRSTSLFQSDNGSEIHVTQNRLSSTIILSPATPKRACTHHSRPPYQQGSP